MGGAGGEGKGEDGFLESLKGSILRLVNKYNILYNLMVHCAP